MVESLADTTLRQSPRARRLLFHMPASFNPLHTHSRQMLRVLTTIKRGDLDPVLWEPRGNGHETLIQALCHDLHMVHVVSPYGTLRRRRISSTQSPWRNRIIRTSIPTGIGNSRLHSPWKEHRP